MPASNAVSKDILAISCHVKPGANATVTVTVEGEAPKTFDLAPTIDWTGTSTKDGARSMFVFVPMNHGAFVYDPAVAVNWATATNWPQGGPGLETETRSVSIAVAGNDVLICGWKASTGQVQTGNFVWTPAESDSPREIPVGEKRPCNLVIANGTTVSMALTLQFDRTTYLQYLYK